MIKLPIYNSGKSALQPRYTCLNVDDVYQVTAVKDSNSSAGLDVIHVYYTNPSGDAGDFLRASIDYTQQTQEASVTAEDVENLKKLIASASQKPGSVPEFELIGARGASAADIVKYQVVDIQIKADDPATT